CIPSKALIEAGHMAANAQGNEELGITTEKVNVDFSKVQKWKGEVVNKLTSGVSSLMKGNKVDVINGEVYFVDDKSVRIMDEKNSQTYNFKNCIIDTGSSPIEIPGFEYSDRILDSEAALALEEIPEKLVVIDGGYIGIERGACYTDFGTDVTILEVENSILSDYEISMTRVVSIELENNGSVVITEAFAISVVESDEGVIVTYDVVGEEKTIDADY